MNNRAPFDTGLSYSTMGAAQSALDKALTLYPGPWLISANLAHKCVLSPVGAADRPPLFLCSNTGRWGFMSCYASDGCSVCKEACCTALVPDDHNIWTFHVPSIYRPGAYPHRLGAPGPGTVPTRLALIVRGHPKVTFYAHLWVNFGQLETAGGKILVDVDWQQLLGQEPRIPFPRTIEPTGGLGDLPLAVSPVVLGLDQEPLEAELPFPPQRPSSPAEWRRAALRRQLRLLLKQRRFYPSQYLDWKELAWDYLHECLHAYLGGHWPAEPFRPELDDWILQYALSQHYCAVPPPRGLSIIRNTALRWEITPSMIDEYHRWTASQRRALVRRLRSIDSHVKQLTLSGMRLQQRQPDDETPRRLDSGKCANPLCARSEPRGGCHSCDLVSSAASTSKRAFLTVAEVLERDGLEQLEDHEIRLEYESDRRREACLSWW